MKIINITKLLAVSSIISVSLLQVVSAHPGRTAADGCHYCRTNCDTWGVPWNERHCHGNNHTHEHSELIAIADHENAHTHDANPLSIEPSKQVIVESR